MISLISAIQLTESEKYYYLYRNGEKIEYINVFESWELEKKFNMKKTFVLKIKPHFSFYGEYEGIELHLL